MKAVVTERVVIEIVVTVIEIAWDLAVIEMAEETEKVKLLHCQR